MAAAAAAASASQNHGEVSMAAIMEVGCGIGAHKVGKWLECHQEREEGYERYRNGIGQAVGHHRAEYLREWRVLSVGDIAGAPHFAQARKHDVYGVGAEYGVAQYVERRLDAYGPELYAPPHGSENHGEHRHGHHQGYIAEVALRAHYFHHLPEVDAAHQHPAQPHADGQRHDDF